MRKIVFSLVFVFAFSVFSTASAAGVGQGLQDLATLLGQNNVGGLISGVIYGNTSNASGNGNGVLPSLSPGPWRCTNPLNCAGPTTAGGSMGDFISPMTSDGNSSSNFANDKAPGPDFSN
ncbi:MAG: hypothetical protein WAW92_01765 [Minisyncoccia bacterium]